jgi:hypothetical protein
MKEKKYIRLVLAQCGIFLLMLGCLQALSDEFIGQTELQVPKEINWANDRTLHVVARIMDADGMPFGDYVRINADYAFFVDDEGKLSGTKSFLPDKKGCIEGLLDIPESGAYAGKLTIYIEHQTDPLNNPYTVEVLAKAEIQVRLPQQIIFSEQSVLYAQNDGLSRPMVLATVYDQFNEPMANTKVRIQLDDVERIIQENIVMTDAAGNVAFYLPASRRKGIATVQMLTGSIASEIPLILYQSPDTEMVSLRLSAEKAGCRVNWDAKTRTVRVRGDGLNLQVRQGKPQVLLNGKSILLAAVPRFRNGILEIPSEFLKELFKS